MTQIIPPQPLSERQNKALSVVESIVESIGRGVPLGDDEKAYRSYLFALTRHLREMGGEPEEYEPVIRSFANELGLPADSIFEVFAEMWTDVIFGVDNSKWVAEAFADAMANPIPVPDHIPGPRTELRKQFYSLVRCLAKKNAPKPFGLSRRAIGPVMDCSKDAVQAMVKWLKKSEVIREVNGGHYVIGKSCKLYELVKV